MMFFVFFILLPEIISADLSAICFGETHLDLPVRYLHIQLTEDGKNLTASKGPIQYKLDIEQWQYSADVVDRGDGMYVFRLVVARPVERVTVRLTLEETALCQPLVISGYGERNWNPEHCDCPVELDEWLQLADCQEEPQIEKDLAPFPTIDFPQVLKKSIDRWGRPEYSRTYGFCHYQIIDNRVHRKCYGEYVGFTMFLDKVLASVTRKMILPNTEFLFNIGDYPLSRPEDAIPMVSWCGSESTIDIVLPTYIYSEQIVEYNLDSANIHSSGNSLHWSQKINKAIFRGRDSNQLRLDLARLSNEEKDGMIDAGITAYFFFDEAENAPRVERMSFSDFFSYKYILSVDGTVAAYRLPSLLAGTSLVLKADSEYYEHFYSKMQPYIHYIPFKKTNIKNVLKWITQTNLNEKYTRRLIEKPTKMVDNGKAGDARYVKCQCTRKRDEL